jgi:hypothetical protein
MRNLRASALAKNILGSGVVDTVPVPVVDHIAYFRQCPKSQPPWFSATIARAGEAGGVDEDAIWNHSLITGAVSRWLIIRHLIGTIARGTFWLTSAALV